MAQSHIYITRTHLSNRHYHEHSGARQLERLLEQRFCLCVLLLPKQLQAPVLSLLGRLRLFLIVAGLFVREGVGDGLGLTA